MKPANVLTANHPYRGPAIRELQEVAVKPEDTPKDFAMRWSASTVLLVKSLMTAAVLTAVIVAAGCTGDCLGEVRHGDGCWTKRSGYTAPSTRDVRHGFAPAGRRGIYDKAAKDHDRI